MDEITLLNIEDYSGDELEALKEIFSVAVERLEDRQKFFDARELPSARDADLKFAAHRLQKQVSREIANRVKAALNQ